MEAPEEESAGDATSLSERADRPARFDDQLRGIRAMQGELVSLADRPAPDKTAPPTAPSLEQFLSGLRTAWQDGEVHPTARTKSAAKRGRRRPDPFAAVTETLRIWFEAEPWRTSHELLDRLMTDHPDAFKAGQIRTLQRRIKTWRSEAAHSFVFGDEATPVAELPEAENALPAKSEAR